MDTVHRKRKNKNLIFWICSTIASIAMAAYIIKKDIDPMLSSFMICFAVIEIGCCIFNIFHGYKTRWQSSGQWTMKNYNIGIGICVAVELMILIAELL